MNKLVIALLILSFSSNCFCEEQDLQVDEALNEVEDCKRNDEKPTQLYDTIEGSKIGNVLEVEQMEWKDINRNKTIDILAYRKTPLVIKNVLTKENLKEQSMDKFCEKFADTEANYRIGQTYQEEGGKYKFKFKRRRTITMREYCKTKLYHKYTSKHDACYLSKMELKEHKDMMNLPQKRLQFLYDKIGNGSIWLGTTNSGSSMHADGVPNFSLQLDGKKVWYIFPQEQNPLLCFDDPQPTALAWASYDIHNDYTCPTGKQADRWRIEMQPGDMLYLPQLTAHTVDNNEPNLMINFYINHARFGKKESLFDFEKLVDKKGKKNQTKGSKKSDML